MDLGDFYRGALTIRRLNVIAGQLLKDRSSAVVRAIDPDGTKWDHGTYVLADFIDYFLAANFKSPKPYPRPADIAKERAFAEQRRAALEAQAERIKAQREAAT